jgi:hypothetical protein
LTVCRRMGQMPDAGMADFSGGHPSSPRFPWKQQAPLRLRVVRLQGRRLWRKPRPQVSETSGAKAAHPLSSNRNTCPNCFKALRNCKGSLVLQPFRHEESCSALKTLPVRDRLQSTAAGRGQVDFSLFSIRATPQIDRDSYRGWPSSNLRSRILPSVTYWKPLRRPIGASFLMSM